MKTLDVDLDSDKLYLEEKKKTKRKLRPFHETEKIGVGDWHSQSMGNRQ